MAREIGIRKNTHQRIFSGARVAYDGRSTQEANDTRDPKNYKAEEAPLRKWAWQRRQALREAAE